MDELRERIEGLWAEPTTLGGGGGRFVEEAIDKLDRGEIRVAERDPETGEWSVNEWVKQAILLYFRLRPMQPMEAGLFHYRDKVDPKRAYPDDVRVVPPAVARHGSFLEPGVVLMPSYVNIGARVGQNSMVDTWATVGSCAQIGADVHLAGGVGIGGVLEPVQAAPVIVEDGAFLGSRAIVVEGVRIGREAVLGANVVITASTPIIDVRGDEPVQMRGEVPERAVVVPGTRPKEFAAGTFQLPAALIIGTRSEATDRKVSLNQALREHGVAG
jgi:2,3,4,5-tetrahydropyridine-2-carboxylate N-succinyltransferase